jgi:hypothetical protein
MRTPAAGSDGFATGIGWLRHVVTVSGALMSAHCAALPEPRV